MFRKPISCRLPMHARGSRNIVKHSKQSYILELDDSRRVVWWFELAPWGYREAHDRSLKIIRMMRESEQTYSFIIGNKLDGRFVDTHRTIATIKMVFKRLTAEPNFSGIFGTVTSNFMFERLSTVAIPLFFNVHCYTSSISHVVYEDVYHALISQNGPSSGLPHHPNDPGFGPIVLK